MIAYTTYPAPNIIAGCNLNEATINELYAWINASVSDVIHLNLSQDSFGLCCLGHNNMPIQMEVDYGKLSIYHCTAVSPLGSLICHVKDIHEPLVIDLESELRDSGNIIYILLQVNHLARQPFGPQSSDFPMRQIHASSKVMVKFVDNEDLAFNKLIDSIPVGRLIRDGNQVILDDKYIPPTLQVGGSSQLVKKVQFYQQSFKELESSTKHVVRRNQDFSNKAQLDLREFALSMGRCLSQFRNGYLSLAHQSRVKEMFMCWVNLGSIVSFTLDSLADRQDFNRLLAENISQTVGNFSVGDFNSTVMALSNFQYGAFGLNELMELVDQFINQIVPLFRSIGEGTMARSASANYGQSSFLNPGSKPFNPKPETF